MLVDFLVKVQGTVLPADHCYGIYSIICKLSPELKNIDWQLNTITGFPINNGLIRLGSKSHLTIRINIDHFNEIKSIQNRQFTLGIHTFYTENFTINSIIPKKQLQSRIVVIKGAEDKESLNTKLGKQCHALEIKPNFEITERKTIKIKRFTVIGYSVTFLDLTEEESLRLQTYGLGGKHKMGCGVF